MLFSTSLPVAVSLDRLYRNWVYLEQLIDRVNLDRVYLHPLSLHDASDDKKQHHFSSGTGFAFSRRIFALASGLIIAYIDGAAEYHTRRPIYTLSEALTEHYLRCKNVRSVFIAKQSWKILSRLIDWFKIHASRFGLSVSVYGAVLCPRYSCFLGISALRLPHS